MAGCPARKSRSTCNSPILRCRSSITFCASSTAGDLLPRANNSPARFISSCFQLLIHRRMNPKLRRQLRQGLLPRKRCHRHSRLKFRAVLFLFTPTSHVLWTGQPLAYPAVQKSGAAAVLSRRRGDFGFDFASDRSGLPDDLKPPVGAALNAVIDRRRGAIGDHFLSGALGVLARREA